jgi:hypothetical protein
MVSFLFHLHNPAYARFILSFRFIQVTCSGVDRAEYINWTKFHCASDVGLNNPHGSRVAHSLHAFNILNVEWLARCMLLFFYLRGMLLSF